MERYTKLKQKLGKKQTSAKLGGASQHKQQWEGDSMQTQNESNYRNSLWALLKYASLQTIIDNDPPVT